MLAPDSAAAGDAVACAYRADLSTGACCGSFGQTCCEGTTCTGNATCVGGSCEICGEGWEYCCDGTKCTPQGVCGVDDTCVGCGGYGQYCCLQGSQCDNPYQCCLTFVAPRCQRDGCI